MPSPILLDQDQLSCLDGIPDASSGAGRPDPRTGRAACSITRQGRREVDRTHGGIAFDGFDAEETPPPTGGPVSRARGLDDLLSLRRAALRR